MGENIRNDENVIKQTKIYESVKTRLKKRTKMYERWTKMKENALKRTKTYENERKHKKIDKNV